MNEIDMNQLLSQLRSTAAAAHGRPAVAAQANANAPDFLAMMKGAINNVNESQQSATKLAEAFEVGDPSVDLTSVMVSLQKANLSFQAMTQVRNKLVSAYQEIMNMSV
jgi:flagellar hook-basal body complex protein FliE